MLMNNIKYSYKIVSENDDFIWIIIENETNQIIKKYFFEEDAINHCQILNSGGGFNGFTPKFIIDPVNIDKNINEKFNIEVY